MYVNIPKELYGNRFAGEAAEKISGGIN